MALTKITHNSGDANIGISAKARAELSQVLAVLLANTYTLQLKTQFYHWNVTGPNFQQLHLLFESQYNQLAASVDELAERIRALGHNTPGTFREFSKLSTLKEDNTVPTDWQVMVYNLTNAHEALARELRSKIETAQKAGDEGTADLFIKQVQEHEKAAWFLRSHI